MLSMILRASVVSANHIVTQPQGKKSSREKVVSIHFIPLSFLAVKIKVFCKYKWMQILCAQLHLLGYFPFKWKKAQISRWKQSATGHSGVSGISNICALVYPGTFSPFSLPQWLRVGRCMALGVQLCYVTWCRCPVTSGVTWGFSSWNERTMYWWWVQVFTSCFHCKQGCISICVLVMCRLIFLNLHFLVYKWT